MRRKAIASVAAALAACCVSAATLAGELPDPLGFYIGGAVGRGDVRLNQTPQGGFLDFHESDLAWQAMLGLRPIRFLGAEAQYVDFGHPSTTTSPVSTDVHARAFSLAALGYLPIAPLVDLFAKAGSARLQTTASAVPAPGVSCVPGFACGLFRLDRNDTRFLYGGGVQVGVQAFHVRAEYQRISSSGGDPSVLSLGLTWTF